MILFTLRFEGLFSSSKQRVSILSSFSFEFKHYNREGQILDKYISKESMKEIEYSKKHEEIEIRKC